MDPATVAAIIKTGGDIVNAGFSGQDSQDPGKLHSRWADPYQGALFQQQMQRGLSGAGDFGMGAATKQGTSQLQQMMADRGIAPGSGVATAATGSMLANAAAQDVGNRRNWNMALLNATPKKETSGHGWDEFKDFYGRYNAGGAREGTDIGWRV